MRTAFHCSFVLLLSLATVSPARAGGNQASLAPEPGEATFTVFVGGRQVGRQQVVLTRTNQGWTIASTGDLGGSLSLSTRKFEARYDPAWRPLGLTIDAMFRGQHLGLEATIDGTSATTRIIQARETEEKTDTIAPDAVILPNNFYAAYEALAVRLAGATTGAQLPIFIPPQGQILMSIGEIAEERIQVADRTITARRHAVTFRNPLGFLDAEVWSDETGRLVRVRLPSIEIVRSDVASVAARQQRITRAGDEGVRIPALGFSLAGTLSKPRAPAEERLPAVVLVGGVAPLDRDETIGGIPIFGQLADALADAGVLVLRYDKRGLGQSGGRPEGASLGDYATDVRAVVSYLEDREDVDDDRIAVLGHGEGGWIALQAASREGTIAAVVLAGSPGTTGATLVLEQQRAALGRLSLTEEERQARIDLQAKINEAVMSGTGWEGIDPELREQAETPWFRSLLGFDPADVIERVRQPILVLHGTLDTEVRSHHADRLAELARARDRRVAADVVRIPGVNHLLVPAQTGETDEYARLEDGGIDPGATSAIADWLFDQWTRPGR